jgi:hypothetical protein
MMSVGISDTIWNRMLNGPAVADPSRGVVALEGSAPMTPEDSATARRLYDLLGQADRLRKALT